MQYDRECRISLFFVHTPYAVFRREKKIRTIYGEVYIGTSLKENDMFHGVYRPVHGSKGQVAIKCSRKVCLLVFVVITSAK